MMMTLKSMIAAGHYDYVNPEITPQRFPVMPERFTKAWTHLYEFDKVMDRTQIEAAIRVERYEPATIETLLAFGAANPFWKRQGLIVALGSTWIDPDDGCCRFPCLDYFGGRIHLGLVYAPWGAGFVGCRYLGSR